MSVPRSAGLYSRPAGFHFPSIDGKGLASVGHLALETTHTLALLLYLAKTTQGALNLDSEQKRKTFREQNVTTLRMIIENFKQTADSHRPAPEVIADLNGRLELRDRSSLLASLRDCSIFLQNGPIL